MFVPVVDATGVGACSGRGRGVPLVLGAFLAAGALVGMVPVARPLASRTQAQAFGRWTRRREFFTSMYSFLAHKAKDGISHQGLEHIAGFAGLPQEDRRLVNQVLTQQEADGMVPSRPIVGTSVDTRFAPEPLTAWEEQLLLSTWRRHPTAELPMMFAVNTWLATKRDILRENWARWTRITTFANRCSMDGLPGPIISGHRTSSR